MFELIKGIDIATEQFILSMHNLAFDKIFNLITQFGGTVFSALVFVAICYFLWREQRSFLGYFMSIFVINEILTFLIKVGIGRQRPLGSLKYLEFNGSMPSGHVTASMFLYGYICFLIYRLWPSTSRFRSTLILALILAIVLIGFSRLYLDVHYLSDVLVGFVIGGASLYTVIKLSPKKEEKNR